MFILIGIPFIIVASAGAYLLYVRILRPSPVALGSVIPKFCVVSADEICEFCESNERSDTYIPRNPGRTPWAQLTVVRRYIAQMTWNTRLIQQVARFEQLKIDPDKSSLDYESRETLALRLADEAASVRLLLLKSQVVLCSRILSGRKLRVHAIQKLQQSMREYKQLEQDAVALVSMAKDRCYYAMLVERLGLSDWRLIEDESFS